jgi:hypothetical protein
LWLDGRYKRKLGRCGTMSQQNRGHNRNDQPDLACNLRRASFFKISLKSSRRNCSLSATAAAGLAFSCVSIRAFPTERLSHVALPAGCHASHGKEE